MIRTAILSVSEKGLLAGFATGLAELGVKLLSTGNTARSLRETGLSVTDVSEYTGSPEILDGRVKTLHPRVHGGILARRDLPSHWAQMAEHGITPIDLVVSNLYPFERTVARGASLDACIEDIDVGGPTMIRAAAKNWQHVGVVVDTADYDSVLLDLREGGCTLSDDARWYLAKKAFALTASYDAAITAFFRTART